MSRARVCFGSVGGDRGLDGDPDLVVRAILDEVERKTFRATPTGPFIEANLDDAHAAVLQLALYCSPGQSQLRGGGQRENL
jgi:hypothetical protein